MIGGILDIGTSLASRCKRQEMGHEQGQEPRADGEAIAQQICADKRPQQRGYGSF